MSKFRIVLYTVITGGYDSVPKLNRKRDEYWLKPGESYVREICFAQIYQGQNSWAGFPKELTNGGNLKVKMKAIFAVDIDTSYDGAPLWHGRIESQPVVCRIFDGRSTFVDPSPYGE